MYKINEIFKLDNEYSNRVKFCNENNLIITEITKLNDKERTFIITKPLEMTKEEIIYQNIKKLKSKLIKYKEDVEQVELFDMERSDYNEKKDLCKQIIIELRELEKQLETSR